MFRIHTGIDQNKTLRFKGCQPPEIIIHRLQEIEQRVDLSLGVPALVRYLEQSVVKALLVLDPRLRSHPHGTFLIDHVASAFVIGKK